MSKNQRDGLRMFGVEQFAELLRIGALQLREVALFRLLGAAQLHHQIVRTLLAKGLGKQPAGIIQAAVHHEALRLQQFPEFFENRGGNLWSNAAQIRKLLCQALHVGLGKSAKDLLGKILSHSHQEYGGFARAASDSRVLPCAVLRILRHLPPIPLVPLPKAPMPLPHGRPVKSLLSANHPRIASLLRVNPALQKPRTLRRFLLYLPGYLLENLLRPDSVRGRA